MTDQIRGERVVYIDRANGKHVTITYSPHSDMMVFEYSDDDDKAQFGISLEEWQIVEGMLDIAEAPCGDDDPSIVRALADQRERFHEVLSDQGPDNDESMEGSQIYAMLDHIWKRVQDG
jgi:hypothetical protein